MVIIGVYIMMCSFKQCFDGGIGYTFFPGWFWFVEMHYISL